MGEPVFFTDCSMAVLLRWIFFVTCVLIISAVLSCRFLVANLELADLLSLSCVM